MNLKSLTLIGGILLLLNSSCNRDGFKRTDDGLKYKLFAKGKGTKPKLGDYLTIDMLIKSDKDSILIDTRKRHQAIATLMLTPSFKGGIEDGFAMMAEGDSGVFVVSADSIFLKTFQKPLPESIKKGSMLTFYLTMIKITPKDEYEEEQKQKEAEYMKKIAERKEKEPEIIKEYITKNHITAKPTTTGLYFINKVTGKGAKPAQGKSVQVRYVGKFLNGSVFDQSDESKPPFSFHIQQREVIPGWDEAIAMMREGGKATIIVPSSLGYGESGQGKVIPPYTPLVFDIELVEVEK
jgi:FKBP-type peptidyl-prolyl cis-trans isomerase FkpA